MKLILTSILCLFLFNLDAQIIYTDVNPDLTTTLSSSGSGSVSSVCPVDFNADGTLEYRFRWDDYGSFGWFLHMRFGSNNINLKGTTTNPYGARYIQAMSNGSNISSSNNWGNSFPEPLVGDNTDPNFQGLGDKYIGCKFSLGSNTYYGWVRISFDGNKTMILKDYAYNATPNTPILAGDMGTSNNILVSSIVVSGQGNVSTISVPSGTLQMTTSILPANATNSTVTWSISNGNNLATISPSGLLTSIANGTVTVKATANDGSGVTGIKNITITNQTPANIPVTSIAVAGSGNLSTISVANGTLQMQAFVFPTNATNNTVTWSISSGTNLATISSSGLLTAIANGSVTVMATANDGSGVSGVKNITISNQTAANVPVSSIVVSGTGNANSISTLNGTLQMQATVLPSNATNKTVTWSLQNGIGIASIDINGKLTALADGIVTVKATANDGSGVKGMKDIIITNQTTAIVSKKTDSILIYPIPTQDQLYISMEPTMHVQSFHLVNQLGQIIKSSEGSFDTKITLDVSNLIQGVYFLIFNLSNNITLTKSFIIE